MMKAEIKNSVPHAVDTRRGIFKLTASHALRYFYLLLVLVSVSALIGPARVAAQEGEASRSIYGDVKIDNKADTASPPPSVTIVLYKEASGEVGRQTVSSGGRYRFVSLMPGDYQVAVEVEGNEIARVPVSMLPGTLSNSPYGFKQDLEFEWRPKAGGAKPITGVIRAADAYNRSAANTSLFQKAQEAAQKKKYDQAVAFLRQIVERDKLDFQAWTILGTVYLLQEKFTDAEQAYLSAIEAKPTFTLALLDLGRLRSTQKKFEEAISPLTRAVESQPESAEANLLLGEAYLQVKKGSKAISYLNEAARLGRPEAHLRLGWLYNAAGMKDKAVVEYEEFLKKRPDYADRKKLEEYIQANKKG